MAEEKALPWKKVSYNLTLMLAGGVILVFAFYLLPSVQERQVAFAEQEAAVSVSTDSSGRELPALTSFVFGISEVVWIIIAAAVMIPAFGELFVAQKMGKRWFLVPLFAVALGTLALQALALVLSSMTYL